MKQIHSVGYMAVTVSELDNIMREKSIDLLVDLRSWPYSRLSGKHEFNKNRLEGFLGDRYVYMGHLLGGKHGPAKQKGIDWLIAEAQSKSLILICFEANPLECHRFYDIGKRLQAKLIEVIHICEGGDEYTTDELSASCPS